MSTSLLRSCRVVSLAPAFWGKGIGFRLVFTCPPPSSNELMFSRISLRLNNVSQSNVVNTACLQEKMTLVLVMAGLFLSVEK